jgi:two-component system cell cycle sensor histidine kinase/response regulator CckA
MTWFLRRFGRVAIPAAALALQPWPAAAHFHETQAPVAPIMLLFALVVLAAAAYLWMLRKAAIFRDAMASVSRPRQVVDPEGKTFYATPAFRELLGDDTRPTPDCLAEQAADEEARQQVELLARNAKSGISGYAEIRVRPRGEGSAVEWRYVAAYPIEKWPGYVYWLVDDVRPKRQMDELILGEQRRFLDLLQDTPLGFYSLDGEGRFLFVNQRLADWLGRSREALQSGKLKLHHILAPPPPPGTAPSDALGGGEDQGDIVLKAADGGTFRAAVAQETERDETGEVQHSRAVVRHLTEESSLSGALAQAQRRFDHFFGHAPVGVALVDAEGQVIECNKVVRGLTGRDDGVPAGTDLLELIHEESRAAVEELLARAAEADGATGASAPVEARLAGEGETVCALFLNRVEAEEGGAFEYIVHFIDTTEQRSLEAQFVQSQKMQAVGQLAGGIAHDFNNLLTAMIGFSDLLLLRHRPGDQSFADIMQIKQNANRAANLVRQLLAFSRQQTLQPKIVNITDIGRVGTSSAATYRREHRAQDGPWPRPGHDQGRPGPARAGHHQFGGQRARRHVRRRHPDDPDGQRASRARHQAQGRDHAGWRLHPGPGDRQRQRHLAHESGPNLRPLLHHQGSRRRHRPGALDGLRHRQADRRLRLRRQQSG